MKVLDFVIVFLLEICFVACFEKNTDEEMVIHWGKLIDRRTLDIHNIDLAMILNLSNSLASGGPVVICADREDFVGCESLHHVAMFPSQPKICYFLPSSTACPSLTTAATPAKDVIHLGPIPQFIKIDPSFLHYLQDQDYFFHQMKKATLQSSSQGPQQLPRLSLNVELNPFVTHNTTLTSQVMNDILSRVNALLRNKQLELSVPEVIHSQQFLFSSSLFTHLQPFYQQMKEPLEEFNDFPQDKSNGKFNFNCTKMNVKGIHQTSNGFVFEQVEKLSRNCLLGMVVYLSSEHDIMHLSITSSPVFLNYDVKGYVQSGISEYPMFNDIGLNGENQIIGVADSGINDLSCFFIDDIATHQNLTQEDLASSNATSTSDQSPISVVTSRNGKIEKFRRKVIQYVAFADGIDDKGGHGTHVCGSLVGESDSIFSSMNGIISKAKIAFYDIGASHQAELKLPRSLREMFQVAYDAGARVHSNSWGAIGAVYGQYAYTADKYLFEHPDFLLVYAAGNSGSLGLHTVSAPGNAKNVLTVGAGQLKDSLTDEMLGNDQYNVAKYSSLGPTYDGRYKPDIIAPGDSIVSAYAGNTEILEAAISSPSIAAFTSSYKKRQQFETCAVHQNTGTSMSTPLVSGSAILLRQYLIERGPKLCQNSNYQLLTALFDNQQPIADVTIDQIVLEIQSWNCSFHPSGYLLKTLIIHSGNRISLYSDPLYNTYEENAFLAMRLGKAPDYFQGYGKVNLANIISSSIYKQRWRHILLNARLEGQSFIKNKMFFWDQVELMEHETLQIEVNLTDLSKRLFASQGDSFAIYSDEMLPSYPLKVTICWYDEPIPFSFLSSLLVNDIDLYVRHPPHSMSVKMFTDGVVTRPTEIDDLFSLGNKRDGIYSKQDILSHRVIPDEKNPNEQVNIDQSLCDYRSSASSPHANEDCIYTIYIKPKSLLKHLKQYLSVAVSTYGSVIAPGLVHTAENPFRFLSDESRKLEETISAPSAGNPLLSAVEVNREFSLPFTPSTPPSNHLIYDTENQIMIYNEDISSVIAAEVHKLASSPLHSQTTIRLSNIFVKFQLTQTPSSSDLLSSSSNNSAEIIKNAITKFTPSNYQLIFTDSYQTVLSIHANPFLSIYYYFLLWPLPSSRRFADRNNYDAKDSSFDYSFNVEEFNLMFQESRHLWKIEIKEFNPAPYAKELAEIGWEWKMKVGLSFQYLAARNNSYVGPIHGLPIIRKLPKDVLEKLNVSYSDDFDDHEDQKKYLPSLRSENIVDEKNHKQETIYTCTEQIITIPFDNIELETYFNYSSPNPFLFESNRVELASFAVAGFLQNLTLHLSAISSPTDHSSLDPAFFEIQNNITTITGSNAFHFTVLIRSPFGMITQVGGFHNPIAQNNFFSRWWPEIWMIRRNTNDDDFIATRDLHAANLSSFPPPFFVSSEISEASSATWKVEVLLNFPLFRQLPKNYSGTIYLSFLPRSDCRYRGEIRDFYREQEQHHRPEEDTSSEHPFLFPSTAAVNVAMGLIFLVLVSSIRIIYFKSGLTRKDSRGFSYQPIPVDEERISELTVSSSSGWKYYQSQEGEEAEE